MIKKKYGQRTHAKKRALERFGHEYTKQERLKIIHDIQNGSSEVKFISRFSNRLSTWQIHLGDQIAIAVYDRNTKEIATFLPEHYDLSPAYR